MSKRITLGDVFSIKTAKGLAYLQYVYKDSDGLELIRVLKGLHDIQPNIESLCKESEQFFIHFCVAAAYRRGIILRVGNVEIKDFQKPKFMRTDHNIRREHLGWHIVNIDTLYRSFVKELTDEQVKLSPHGIWNDTYLIEMLESGFSLEKWR